MEIPSFPFPLQICKSPVVWQTGMQGGSPVCFLFVFLARTKSLKSSWFKRTKYFGFAHDHQNSQCLHCLNMAVKRKQLKP